jgi:hypothetical protein
LPTVEKINQLKGGDRQSPEGRSRGKVLPEGITHKTAHRARAIAAHPAEER